MPTIDQFLQIAAAAELLGVCQNTLRNWGRSGKVTEYRDPLNNDRFHDLEDSRRIAADVESPLTLSSSRHAPEQAGETPRKSR